jgi:putative ABC transport system substrate-binding protein
MRRAVTFRSTARAQHPGTQIVGYLNAGSHDPSSSAWAAFLQGMREVGYIEAQNVSFEIHSAAGQYDRLPALAKSLVDRHVSVIVAQDVVSVQRQPRQRSQSSYDHYFAEPSTLPSGAATALEI